MTKTTSLLAAASLLLPACASAPPGSGIARRWSAPAADRIARLPVMGPRRGRGPGRAAPPRDPPRPRGGRGSERGAAAGPTVVAIQDAGGTPTYTYVGPLGGYRGGLLVHAPKALASLAEAWKTSAFHDPVQAKVGASDVWCTLDKFPTAAGPAPRYRLILMVSRGNPRTAPAAAAASRTKRGGQRGAAAMKQQMEAEAEAGARAFWKAELSVTEPQANLGVSVDRSTPVASQAQGGLPRSVQGALVRAVSPGGPAERAGIRRAISIQGIDGQPVPTSEALLRAVSARAPFTTVMVTVQRGPDRQQVPATLGLPATSDKLIALDGVAATLGDVWLEPDGRLGAVSFAPWHPEAAFFLAGKTSRDLFTGTSRWYDHDIEQGINEALVDWKTRQLPGWLRQATVEDLEEAIVTTEKGILALDLAVRSVKDEIDSAARSNLAGYVFAGEVDQALEQRKMLLGVALQAFKGTAAQRAR